MTFKTNGGGYEQSSQPQSLLTSLPEDVVVDILARVPRHDYPTLSLVSKQFRSLITSHEIYVRRSLLRCTENCIYVLLSSCGIPNHMSLYILRQNSNCRLVRISSLLDLPSGESFVTVGSMIYVFGEMELEMSSRAFSIDCRSHTVQTLPDMPIPMTDTVAGFLDGKIYVIGYYCSMKSEVMLVFNTDTQMWEPEVIKPDTTPTEMCWLGCMAVMADKIYMRYLGNRLIYVPKENKWETDEVLNSKKWIQGACVVDDVLYYYDCDENCLNKYDPKERRWGVVRGLDELLDEITLTYWTKTVPYGQNVVLYFRKGEEEPEKIWYAEISLGRREGGDVWGKVEWCNQVVVADTISLIRSLGVIV